ncbi:MAG: hypothetical protein AABX88_00015 [Nanoarchaeota archaeon]
MENIGFTTGSLYRSEIPFEKRIELYHSLGANAIELSFGTPTQLFEFQLSEKITKDIKKFKFITIHAPWKEVRYNESSETRQIINKLKTLNNKFSVKGIVLHPDTIDDFDILVRSGLPFLLENMDKRKDFGTLPKHFEELKNKYNFDFVLDLQHAYEHDHSMQLTKNLIELMGKRLKHMHVSGHTKSEIHVPTYLADNKDAITKILKLRVDVPKILEGILLEDINETIKSELEYVKIYERKF